MVDPNSTSNLEECNLEVLSLNAVFPSTSEESISDDDTPVKKKLRNNNKKTENLVEIAGKSTYAPMNSKSSTGSRQKEPEGQPSVFSDFDLPKNTLHVVGSNPGEPKMSYQDPPRKISKTVSLILLDTNWRRLIPCSGCIQSAGAASKETARGLAFAGTSSVSITNVYIFFVK